MTLGSNHSGKAPSGRAITPTTPMVKKQKGQFEILNTERALLGVLIRDAVNLPEDLSPEHFVEPEHIEIARVLVILRERNVPPDELTVSAALREFHSTIDAAKISLLTSDYPNQVLNPAWSRQIKAAAVQRNFIQGLQVMMQKALEPEPDIDSIVDAFLERRMCDSRVMEPDGVFIDKEDLLNFDKLNDPSCLIGNRWLCREGSLLISGQSGIGKSSLTMQFAIVCASGGDFFGIKVHRPLKTMIIQAENDLGDLAEQFQGVISGLRLPGETRKIMMDNLLMTTNLNTTGWNFLTYLRRQIQAHKPDVVIIDPLFSFAGFDLSNQEQMSNFLRQGLHPIQKQHGTIIVAVHHATKPRSDTPKNGNASLMERAYSSHGSAELINYFREVMVLTQCSQENDSYELSLSKRRKHSGMLDHSGKPSVSVVLKHSSDPGSIFWEYRLSLGPIKDGPKNPF